MFLITYDKHVHVFHDWGFQVLCFKNYISMDMTDSIFYAKYENVVPKT